MAWLILDIFLHINHGTLPLSIFDLHILLAAFFLSIMYLSNIFNYGKKRSNKIEQYNCISRKPNVSYVHGMNLGFFCESNEFHQNSISTVTN